MTLLRRSAGAVIALALMAGGFGAGLAGTAAAAVPASRATLYVSPSGSNLNSDTSCYTAAYSSIQDAVSQAAAGDTVFVCAGTYNEQVTVSTSDITLSGAVGATIDPTSATPTTVSDLDTEAATVPIVDVTPGTTGVTIRGLTIDGSGLTPSFTSCSVNYVGILYQAASGMVTGDNVQNIVLPANLFGCQDGIGILVEAGPTGTATVTISGNSITNYDKNGVTCSDPGTTCTVMRNMVTGGGPLDGIAQNGVQIGPGGGGEVVGNQIAANDYTGTPNETEPQADYSAGVLLYGATGRTAVRANTLTDNQIGIEVVHSSTSVIRNTIGETGSGITDSVGMFAVPCDIYCSYFDLSGGSENDLFLGNTISFPGTPTSGTIGIWAGDVAASATGTVHVFVAFNSINGAEHNVLLGPTAHGFVLANGPRPTP